jgi:excisionase family DNA binding protein
VPAESRPDRRQTAAAPRVGGRRITDLATHPDKYLTVQEFATYLGFHEKTVRKWIGAAVLPAYRLPPVTGDWRISTADALAFMAQARFTAQSPPARLGGTKPPGGEP